MKPDSPHRTRLIAEQLETLRRMAAVYRQSRDAFVALDLAALQTHTATLDWLASELLANSRGLDPEESLPEDLRRARNEVHALNRAFAEVVRRSQRSTKVMLNVIQPQAGTANPPAFHAYV